MVRGLRVSVGVVAAAGAVLEVVRMGAAGGTLFLFASGCGGFSFLGEMASSLSGLNGMSCFTWLA